jgi:adhesin transport system outer membrane protein
LPIGVLASAFVAVAMAGAETGAAKIAATPSSEEPVQLVPAEGQPANTPQVAPATSQEAASVEPQVAQSGEGEAKDAQEEPDAFPPETLTDRAGVETLGDVVRYAVLNHPAIKQSVAVKHGSEFAVDEEYAGYLPSVDLSAQAGWEHTDSPGTRAAGRKHGRGLWNSRSGLAVDQPLFTGFQTVERVAAARHTVIGNTRLISANAEDIAVGAVQSYLDVQRNREFVRIAEKNVQVHLDILDKVKKRAARIGVRSDVDQADGRVALANALLEERRQGLRDSESQFQNFVGLFPGNLSSDIDPRRIPELDLQTIVNQSLAANPRVLAIRSEIRSNRAAARATDAPFFPSLSLRLDNGFGEDFGGTEGNEYSFGAMVVFSYNLFQGGADLARKRQAVEQVNAAVFEEKDLLRAITDEANRAYSAFVGAKVRLGVREAQLRSTQRVSSAYEKQFETSRRTLLDLLDSITEQFNAETSIADERSRFTFAYFRTLAVMGSLLDELSVHIPQAQLSESSVD